MKKITEQVATAFRERRAMRKDNTEIEVLQDGTTRMKLFGNTIAVMNRDGLTLCDCGWKTKTTKERMNGILKELYGGLHHIHAKRGQWFIGDKSIEDNTPILIS